MCKVVTDHFISHAAFKAILIYQQASKYCAYVHLYVLHRCRKLLLELKRKKEEYDKLMDKLQKDVRERYMYTSFAQQ